MRKKLIVMLKFPRPGTVKTRLIPALGADRACALYEKLVRHTLDAADACGRETGAELEIRLAHSPGDTEAKHWLGPNRLIREQGEGSLGERLERAVGSAFDAADAVVVIGADCPQLTSAHLQAAFVELTRVPLVVGPARDGGYYLIGSSRFFPTLFRGISWSTEHVLRQTQLAAEAAHLRHQLLEPLNDLDVPADLSTWAATPAARAYGLGGVSVIIPALNEERLLPATLQAVIRGCPHEIVVVDGGSTDGTIATARAHDAIVLSTPAGRAAQMNAGAAIATGEFLLFLHADTLPPADYSTHLKAALRQPGVSGGAFTFALAADFPGRRLIERGTNWRARNRQLPYGDQGIFLTREIFSKLGGFPALPIMEDYEFVRRLGRIGTIVIAPVPSLTSGRRWQRLGALRTTLINQLAILSYRAGVSPHRLARWYRGPRPSTAKSGNKSTVPAVSSSG